MTRHVLVLHGASGRHPGASHGKRTIALAGGPRSGRHRVLHLRSPRPTREEDARARPGLAGGTVDLHRGCRATHVCAWMMHKRANSPPSLQSEERTIAQLASASWAHRRGFALPTIRLGFSALAQRLTGRTEQA